MIFSFDSSFIAVLFLSAPLFSFELFFNIQIAKAIPIITTIIINAITTLKLTLIFLFSYPFSSFLLLLCLCQAVPHMTAIFLYSVLHMI